MTDDAGWPARKKLTANLAQPTAFGWPLLVVSTVVFVVDGFPFLGGNDLSGSRFDAFGVVVVAALLAQIPMVIVLGLGRLTWLRLGISRRHPSVAVITVFVATLFADGVFQGHIAANIENEEVVAWVIDQVLYKTVALVFFAVVIVDLNKFRSQTRLLNRTRAVLTESLARAEYSMSLEETRTSEIVEYSLLLARDGLTDDDLQGAGLAMRRIATDIVRPLSHELINTDIDVTPAEVPPVPRPGWRDTLAHIVDAPLIAPRSLAIVMVVLAWRQTVTSTPETPAANPDGSVSVTFDLAPFVEAISVLTVIFISTLVAAKTVSRYITTHRSSRSTTGTYMANTFGIGVIAVVVLASLAIAYQLPWFPEPPRIGVWTPFLVLIPMMLLAVIQAFLRSLESRRSQLLEDLERSNTDLDWTIKAISERIWFQRRRLAHQVHGPVQSRLNAASIRVLKLVESTTDEETRRTELALIRAELEAISTDVMDDDTPSDVIDGFRTLTAMWHNVCHIEWEVPEPLTTALVASPACAAAINEITQEAVANSITHGKASIVMVRMNLPDQRTVRLFIEDNGSAPSGDSSPGLGTQLLNEVATNWNRTVNSTGSTLVVDVPLTTSSL